VLSGVITFSHQVCTKSTLFQSWIDHHLKHDVFSSLGKSPIVCSQFPLCIRIVPVGFLAPREGTHFSSSAGWCSGDGDNTVLPFHSLLILDLS